MIIQFLPCPICKSKQYRQMFIIHDYPIIECITCGLIRTQHNLDHHDILNIYEQYYFKKSSSRSLGYSDYYAGEEQLRKNFKKRIKNIIRENGPSISLFEIGSGPGFFLSECENAGIKAQGIEIEKEAVDFAKRKLNLNILQTSIENIHFKEQFDVVCAWDVIEHVNDPNQFLSQAKKALKPNGTLYLSTGDTSSLMAKLSGRWWHLYTPPGHLYFFSTATINKLLHKQGFEAVHISYPSQWYSVNYTLERLLKGSIHKSFIQNLNYHQFNILDKLSIPINLFDVMEIESRTPKSSD